MFKAVPEGATWFKIKRATNGLVLSVMSNEPEECEEIVFQELDEEENAIESFAEFLRMLDHMYGPSTSRYSKKRIYIKVGPGDNHEDFTDEDADELFG